MGTPDFAVPSLDALCETHEVVLVCTRPDAPAGRGGRLIPSPVKVRALACGVDVVEPLALRGLATEHIAALAPDVICVAAYGMLLPPETLAIPALGCINVHASLLPRHRGAAPIQRAVLEGDTVTGVSIMRMEEGLDTGPYALQRTLSIEGRYADEIETELARLGAEALIETLALIESGSAAWVAQDPAGATYAAKIAKDDVALLPDLDTDEAFRRVRAATHRAPARACLGDREVTVVRATPAPELTGPGAVCMHDGHPVLGFSDGSLVLDVVRPAGKADMTGAEWARGARMTEGVCWRCTR
jgi:methionyl-tRNA formyltransferase